MSQTINEHVEVGRMATRFADYQNVTAATLIMRGRGSGASRQAIALARLAETIPDAEALAFPRLDHFGPEKNPAGIADAVLRFFAAHA